MLKLFRHMEHFMWEAPDISFNNLDLPCISEINNYAQSKKHSPLHSVHSCIWSSDKLFIKKGQFFILKSYDLELELSHCTPIWGYSPVYTLICRCLLSAQCSVGSAQCSVNQNKSQSSHSEYSWRAFQWIRSRAIVDILCIIVFYPV